MARSEARLAVEIWSDPDFLNLSSEAQRMFMFLLSQSDLAHDGVLALRERRWSTAARGLTRAVVEAALTELQDHRFVVIDETTEELLIRSFLRRDKVYKQPNVLRAAADHLPMVASRMIRRALAVELARISQTPMPEPSAAIVAEMRQALPDPTENPSPDPSDKGSAKDAPGTPGERGVVTDVSNGFPVPRSSDLVPRPLASLAPLSVTQRSKLITDDYAEHEPMCKWPAVNGVVIKAIKAEKWSDDEIRSAMRRLAIEGRSVTVETLRLELNGMPPRASPKGSTTNSRVDAALALAAELERQEIGS